MDLHLAARWLAANQELDPRLLPLLRAVARTGSLNQAVAALGLSYRHAWGSWERRSACSISRWWYWSVGAARA